ncbi:GrpB family protein [Pseudoxanthomonas suwonensis]|uniref:GrpB family protein n=1 Tax=Pseudoxanthomonas suwonensis TaxID=314722 RepID=A0A0E3Z2K3_9GAMM|nr:GrpB family protein [Pseudoxanthomonas suwonensis]AKC86977.1 hypothetical protein WQ53_09660 [Pseudoxanthomonas suwonensis]
MRAVQLQAHDPAWADEARAEALALAGVLDDGLLAVHHIGSTAIPGLPAKPVIDLLAVARTLAVFDRRRGGLEALGYRWRGENGLPGRRYLTREDPGSGRRRVQLHGYAEGAADIVRHLAFRDFLRSDPRAASDYAREKLRCQSLHPDDTGAYSDCKADWIRRTESIALAAMTMAAASQTG